VQKFGQTLNFKFKKKKKKQKKTNHQPWTAQKFQNFQGPSELATMNQHPTVHPEG
jgi:hypothetical protein